MDDRECLDYVRGFYSRMVKPFERLPEVFERAATAQDRVREADALKARLQAENDGLALDRARLADELASERVAAEAERAERAAALAALREQLHEARNKAQAEILEIEVRKRDAITMADAEAVAHRVALDAQIAALVVTRDELQKGVREIQDKYRALVG